MTFSPKLYPAEFYPNIHFVVETGFPAHDLFPFLKNPIATIPPEKKPLYHALCNIAANFPALLWVQVFATFEGELQLPSQLLQPLIHQSMENIFAQGAQALTGPLRRGDLTTMTLHESALLEYPTLRTINQSWNEWAKNYPLPEAPQ
jgi:2-dehydropantoate 2-reductase